MRRVSALMLAALLAVTGLTACMSDDSSSSRGERRSAALVQAGEQGGAEIQLTMSGITPAQQAIEVLSYSWGATRDVGAARPEFGALRITKTLDQTSPLIYKALALGNVIQTAELKLYKDFGGRGAAEYGKFQMEGVFITSYQNSGAAQGQSLPVEELALNYQRLRETTMLPDEQGRQGPPVEFGWDLLRQREW